MKWRNLSLVVGLMSILVVIGVGLYYCASRQARPAFKPGLSVPNRPDIRAPRLPVQQTGSGISSSAVLTGAPARSCADSTNALSLQGGSPGSSPPQRYVNSLAPDIRPSTKEMVFLDFQIDKGQVTLRRQWKVPGKMRLPSLVVPEKGIYHRIVTAEGKMLAQGITPDPTLVYYDYRDPDSGRPAGGELLRANASFNVRYPWVEGADRIELYQVEAATDLTRLTPNGSHYYGSFKMPAAAQ